MLYVEYTSQFKRDLKLIRKRHLPLKELEVLMKKLVEQTSLPVKVKDHALTGNWNYHRELHIQPDWLLIYRYALERHAIIFVRTGSHADLFK